MSYNYLDLKNAVNDGIHAKISSIIDIRAFLNRALNGMRLIPSSNFDNCESVTFSLIIFHFAVDCRDFRRPVRVFRIDSPDGIDGFSSIPLFAE